MAEPGSPIPTSTLEYYRALPKPLGRPPRDRYWLHALLLLATCFTTLVTGARMQDNFAHNLPALSLSDDAAIFPISWFFSDPHHALQGLPLAPALMLFFPAHAIDQYLSRHRYRIHPTLPVFIPLPPLIGAVGP